MMTSVVCRWSLRYRAAEVGDVGDPAEELLDVIERGFLDEGGA
jgi:hypothetical protein